MAAGALSVVAWRYNYEVEAHEFFRDLQASHVEMVEVGRRPIQDEKDIVSVVQALN